MRLLLTEILYHLQRCEEHRMLRDNLLQRAV